MSSRVSDSLRNTAAWRISTWTTIAFALGTAIAFCVMYSLVQKGIDARSDAWLVGESQVLSDVAANAPRDSLYDRLVEEVAELASREVIDPDGKKGASQDSVFFLQLRSGQAPLWVGPSPMNDYVTAIQKAELNAGVPGTVLVPGRLHSFRVVYNQQSGSRLYLGYSDLPGIAFEHRLVVSFCLIWLGMVVLGFLVCTVGAFRTLQRVEQITETVANIGSDDLGTRLPASAGKDEIARLSQTFNRMLDRIQRSVHQMRVLTDSVAHDLKSPVTSIRGSLEMALSMDGAWRDSVGTAIEKLDRLSSTINTALDLAEANAGALHIKRERIRLDEMLKRFADLYSPLLTEKHHHLKVHADDDVVIEGDPGLIERTLANLFDNELAHLPPQSHVEISLAKNGAVTQLVVQDDGPGISQPIKARAFERFVKGGSSAGHGLGLSFVEAIVQVHGGRVTLGERVPHGLLLTIELPISARTTTPC